MGSEEEEVAQQLVSKVERWNEHMSEKKSRLGIKRKKGEMLFALNKTKPNQSEPNDAAASTKRKYISSLSEGDSTTKKCLEIGKSFITNIDDSLQSQSSQIENSQELIKLAKTHSDEKRRKKQKIIGIETNIQSMSEFYEHNLVPPPPPSTEVPQQEQKNTPKVSHITSGQSFYQAKALTDILDRNYHFWERRKSAKMEQGLLLYPKDHISAKHVANIIWQPYGKLTRQCTMSRQGLCITQTEDKLRHPLHPEMACMAYYSPESYDLICSNVVSEEELGKKLGEEMCEFCYRYFIGHIISRQQLGSHIGETEIASRYHMAGIPGEYSVNGMHQPTMDSTTQHINGLVGYVRCLNISDFIPVVGVPSPNNPNVIGNVMTCDDFQSMKNPPDNVVYGWKEVKPFYHLNENAFLEDHQISPYHWDVVGATHPATLNNTIRDYFRKRATISHSNMENYEHVFLDLMECMEIENYIDLPNPLKPANPWKYWCMHTPEHVPNPKTHRLYYCLLLKINSCKRLLSENSPVQVPEITLNKIDMFLQSHRPLLEWMRDNRAISDADLLQTRIPHPTQHVLVPAAYAYRPDTSGIDFYPSDIQYMEFTVQTFERKNPLDVCAEFYLRDHELRTKGVDVELDNLLITHGPVEFPIENSTLAHNFYQTVSQEFEQLTVKLKLNVFDGKWPDNILQSPVKVEDYNTFGGDDFTNSEDDISNLTAKQKRRRTKMKKIQPMIDSMNNAIIQAKHAIHDEKLLYLHVLREYAVYVFCDFAETLQFIRCQKHLSTILEFTDCFKSIFPDVSRLLQISTKTINNVPWNKHNILFACLFRIWVMEIVHTLEDENEHNVRFNIVLLRNSHLRLFREITQNPLSLLTDVELTELREVQGRSNLFSLYELTYPHPEREIHQGLLPDYINGLSKVNFNSNCGMDNQPWNKMQFKKPDRCCDGREGHEMLSTLCKLDKTFYNFTCLELELSLKGLYEHCTFVPCFAKTVLLDELFDYRFELSVEDFLGRFILDNKNIIADATSESLCYMIDFFPSLRDVLYELYNDWFGWRATANMDMVRKCFSDDGNFFRVRTLVYKHIKLDNNKTVYRHVNIDFVQYMCELIKDVDIERYRKNILFESVQKLTLDKKLLIDCFVSSLDTTQSVELTDLRIIHVTDDTLEILWCLNKAFISQGAKNSVQNKRKSNKPVLTPREEIMKMKGSQYVILSFFFERIRRHQSVKAMRIDNLDIVVKQITKLCERYGVTTTRDIPRNAKTLAWSPCCGYVKNTFCRRVATEARGNDEVYYDIINDIVVCAKKEHKAQKVQKVNVAILGAGGGGGNNTERFQNKIARQQERELKKPRCDDTEILFIDMIGEIVEIEGCKIPKAKKAKLSKQELVSGKRTGKIELPKSPFWVTTCCGRLFGFNFECLTPNGYECEICRNKHPNRIDGTQLVCHDCRTQITTHSYRMLSMYDDAYEQKFRRVVFCYPCIKAFKYVDSSALFTSAVLRHSENPDVLSSFTYYL